MSKAMLGRLFCIAAVVGLGACAGTGFGTGSAQSQAGPGFYKIRPGDTIRRVAAEVGYTWQDLARWNNLDNPDLLDVGQVIRIIPPPGTTGTPVVQTTISEPIRSKPAELSAIQVQWPATTSIVRGFGSGSNGVEFSGPRGTPINAAADGTVTYSGTGLSGYGHVLIVNHPAGFMTLYANVGPGAVTNNTVVKAGQKIAEMSGQTNFKFELRNGGKPIDPMSVLPKNRPQPSTGRTTASSSGGENSRTRAQAYYGFDIRWVSESDTKTEISVAVAKGGPCSSEGAGLMQAKTRPNLSDMEHPVSFYTHSGLLPPLIRRRVSMSRGRQPRGAT